LTTSGKQLPEKPN